MSKRLNTDHQPLVRKNPYPYNHRNHYHQPLPIPTGPHCPPNSHGSGPIDQVAAAALFPPALAFPRHSAPHFSLSLSTRCCSLSSLRSSSLSPACLTLLPLLPLCRASCLPSGKALFFSPPCWLLQASSLHPTEFCCCSIHTRVSSCRGFCHLCIFSSLLSSPKLCGCGCVVLRTRAASSMGCLCSAVSSSSSSSSSSSRWSDPVCCRRFGVKMASLTPHSSVSIDGRACVH